MEKTYYHIEEEEKSFLGITAQECYIRAMSREDWDLEHCDLSDPYYYSLEVDNMLQDADYDDESDAEDACTYVGWGRSKDIKGYAAINFETKWFFRPREAYHFCIVPPGKISLPEEVPEELGYDYCDALSPLRLLDEPLKLRKQIYQPVYGGIVMHNITEAVTEFKKRLEEYACPLVLATAIKDEKGKWKADKAVALAYPVLAAYNKEPFLADHLYPVYEFSFYFRYIDHEYEYDSYQAAMDDYYEMLGDEERERRAGIW